MDTIFMNSGNGKTPDPRRLLLNFLDKINLKRKDKYVALSKIRIYYIIFTIFKIINLKYQLQHFNEEFELPDGSYPVSDFQDYFEYMLKKHETGADNPSVKIYVNKIENRITFKIKTRYYLELLMPQTIKLL